MAGRAPFDRARSSSAKKAGAPSGDVATRKRRPSASTKASDWRGASAIRSSKASRGCLRPPLLNLLNSQPANPPTAIAVFDAADLPAAVFSLAFMPQPLPHHQALFPSPSVPSPCSLSP